MRSAAWGAYGIFGRAARPELQLRAGVGQPAGAGQVTTNGGYTRCLAALSLTGPLRYTLLGGLTHDHYSSREGVLLIFNPSAVILL